MFGVPRYTPWDSWLVPQGVATHHGPPATVRSAEPKAYFCFASLVAVLKDLVVEQGLQALQGP